MFIYIIVKRFCVFSISCNEPKTGFASLSMCVLTVIVNRKCHISSCVPTVNCFLLENINRCLQGIHEFNSADTKFSVCGNIDCSKTSFAKNALFEISAYLISSIDKFPKPIFRIELVFNLNLSYSGVSFHSQVFGGAFSCQRLQDRVFSYLANVLVCRH